MFIKSLTWSERYVKEAIEGETIVDIEITDYRMLVGGYNTVVGVYSNGMRAILPDRFASLRPTVTSTKRLA